MMQRLGKYTHDLFHVERITPRNTLTLLVHVSVVFQHIANENNLIGSFVT